MIAERAHVRRAVASLAGTLVLAWLSAATSALERTATVTPVEHGRAAGAPTSSASGEHTPWSRDGAATRCEVDGVRVAVLDAGEITVVDVSVRLRPHGGAAEARCEIDWGRITVGSAEGTGAAPTLAVAASFESHRMSKPLVLADGLAIAATRRWRGVAGPDGAIAGVRLIYEGTSTGIRFEIPRQTFPEASTPGARVERRVKGGRAATARFGPLGGLPIAPSAAGSAGAVGPTSPLDGARIVVEVAPSTTTIAGGMPVPGAAVTLQAFRDLLPTRALELSTANDAGWDDLARRAYAAALHSDPVVASLGVYSLAWLAAGLSLEATRLSTAAAGTDVAVVPKIVLTSIGDAAGRLATRYGAVGKLLPLGRPATFRRALAARPWLDPARAKAARDAVGRLATFSTSDLVPYLVPQIIDASPPVDPPAPLDPATSRATPLVETSASDGPDRSSAAHTSSRRPRRFGVMRWSRRHTRATGGVVAVGVLLVIGGAALLRRDRQRQRAST